MGGWLQYPNKNRTNPFPPLWLQAKYLMPAPPDNQDDLNDLIFKADDSVAISAARSKTRIHHGEGFSAWMGRLAGLLLIVGAVWATQSLWHHVAPHSEERVVRDLDAIIEQARHSVESARLEMGRLPERIPNTALANLVFYDYSGEVYRLFVASSDISITLDTDGNKRIDRGAKR